MIHDIITICVSSLDKNMNFYSKLKIKIVMLWSIHYISDSSMNFTVMYLASEPVKVHASS